MTNIANGKGPWCVEEDNRLLEWVKTHGQSKWSHCSDTVPGRSGKQCRERWINNLNPNVKKGNWTAEEDDMIFKGYLNSGSAWSVIAKNLEVLLWKKMFILLNNFVTELKKGRTENSVKNRFYSTVRKLLSDSEKNGVKTSELDIRNFIEMSIGENFGDISSKDANEDGNSLERDISSVPLCKYEEDYQEQQQQITEDQNQDDPNNVVENENQSELNNIKSLPQNIIFPNVKQEEDVIKIEAVQENNISNRIEKEAGTSNEIVQTQNTPEKLSDVQLGDIQQQEHCLYPPPPSGSEQGVPKRKYTRKRCNLDEYSESNFLYRLLKSNDVEIKSSKCLQDYSVLYRKIKQNQKDDRIKQVNKQDQNRNEEIDEEDEIVYEYNNSSEVNQQEQPHCEANQNERYLKINTENKKLICEVKKAAQEQFIVGDNSRKKIKTSQTKEKQQQYDQASNQVEDLLDGRNQTEQYELKKSDFEPDFQRKKTTSSKKKLNDEDDDDDEEEQEQGENFGEMEQQLIKYFQKSMGKFLKKFLKSAKTTTSQAKVKVTGKTSLQKKKKIILPAEGVQKKQQNKHQSTDEFKEQISTEVEKIHKQSSPLILSEDSVEIIEEITSFKTKDQNKLNKPRIITQKLTSNKLESLPLNKSDQQGQKEDDSKKSINVEKQNKQQHKDAEQLKLSTLQVQQKQQQKLQQNLPEQTGYLSESNGISYSNRHSSNQTTPNNYANLQSQKPQFILNQHSNQFYESLPKIGSSSNLLNQLLNKNHDATSIQSNQQSFEQNIDIQSLKNLASNSITAPTSPGQQTVVSNALVDQKMSFLLNQLCTLESMLTNTKQELGKLESTIYQRAHDPLSSSNGEGIAIQNCIPLMYNFGSFSANEIPQQALSLNQMVVFNSRNNAEKNENNSNNLFLERQNSKDNGAQYSDLDNFIHHNN